ncbi:MAG: hypothetical protein GF409_01465 [Candidatus Omnitrophica bacterium]|nr:hypothetical protein [Candidatus Omnitrophota bacterium]
MSMTKAGIIIVLLNLIVVATALFLGETPDEYFAEGALATYISFIQLALISVLCWFVFRIKRTAIWIVICAGFAFLALDEVIMIHEKIDMFIHWLFRMEETALTDRIDDLVILAYAAVGLGVLYRYRKEFYSLKKAAPALIAGVLFMGIMVAGDIISNRADILTDPLLRSWVSAMEDAFKLFAEGAFLFAAYYSYRMNKVSFPGKWQVV